MNVVFIYQKSYTYITQGSSLVGIIQCQRFVALGDKYNFIWKIFCFRDCLSCGYCCWFFSFFFLTIFYTEQEPEDENVGNISSKSVLLTYPGSLWIQYRQGLQPGKLSVCCLFFSSGFTFHLGHFPDFSPCVPGSPPYVPPVKQDSHPLRNHTGSRFMAGESDDRGRVL